MGCSRHRSVRRQGAAGQGAGLGPFGGDARQAGCAETLHLGRGEGRVLDHIGQQGHRRLQVRRHGESCTTERSIEAPVDDDRRAQAPPGPRPAGWRSGSWCPRPSGPASGFADPVSTRRPRPGRRRSRWRSWSPAPRHAGRRPPRRRSTGGCAGPPGSRRLATAAISGLGGRDTRSIGGAGGVVGPRRRLGRLLIGFALARQGRQRIGRTGQPFLHRRLDLGRGDRRIGLELLLVVFRIAGVELALGQGTALPPKPPTCSRPWTTRETYWVLTRSTSSAVGPSAIRPFRISRARRPRRRRDPRPASHPRVMVEHADAVEGGVGGADRDRRSVRRAPECCPGANWPVRPAPRRRR
jgi:hypothetical protein